MITLEQFKKTINIMKKFEQDNECLSDILMQESYGFIDFYFPLLDAIEDLLNEIFQSEDKELLSWWMHDSSDKTVYWTNEGVNYDLTEIKDLYFYLTKQYDKVKQK